MARSKPVRTILPSFLKRFLETEASGGLIMIGFAALGLIAANGPFGALYYESVNMPITLGGGGMEMTESVKGWVKDVLMVFFFMLIGMELKREMSSGFLSQRDQIALPLAAAVGGMLAPAAVFLLFNFSHPENIAGWAVASATDIAFALAILSLFGRGIPPAVKIFLLAIAIFDDLGAILVIAAFYSQGLALIPILLSIAGCGALFALNRRGVTVLIPYMLVGVFLWFCMHAAGIHTTLAGVMVGMAIPLVNPNKKDHEPLNETIHALHPWISYLVLPVFAFTCAGVSLKGLSVETLLAPLPLGVMLGLFIGKQIGIFGTTYALVKAKIVSMPKDATWMHVYGVSVLAGIGFTMSLFIGMLAFDDKISQDLVTIGVIAGSLLSTIWGAAVFKLAVARR
jgi:NhaA family Na+:H+ antiporter